MWVFVRDVTFKSATVLISTVQTNVNRMRHVTIRAATKANKVKDLLQIAMLFKSWSIDGAALGIHK